MVLAVAYINGRRSEAQTFLGTHAMPADIASTLYSVIGDSDGDLQFSIKGLKELFTRRSGYAASATVRAAAKLLLDAEEVGLPRSLSRFFARPEYFATGSLPLPTLSRCRNVRRSSTKLN